MQMLFAGMLIYALHATIEDAEIALNRVRVDRPASVLAPIMPDKLVVCEVAGQRIVLTGFVRHNPGILPDMVLQDLNQCLGVHRVPA